MVENERNGYAASVSRDTMRVVAQGDYLLSGQEKK